MLSCYIVDDEEHAIKSLSNYIARTPALRLLGSESDPVKALAFFQSNAESPDLTFIDVEMPKLSGIELSSLLKDKTAIVFTTAHPNFAFDAFELDVKDYLLKPFSYQRFLKCITKVSDQIRFKLQNREAKDDFFYIQSEIKGKLVKVNFKDIVHIESQKNYISIVTEERKYLTYLTLSEVESYLPAFFLRISKSYIVNMQKITHVEGNEVFAEKRRDGYIVGTTYKDSFQTYMRELLVKSKRN